MFHDYVSSMPAWRTANGFYAPWNGCQNNNTPCMHLPLTPLTPPLLITPQDLHKKTAADSSSDSESESEDTPKTSTAAANGTHKTAKSPAAAAAASSDDEGSESDEGLDDEAMLRMDAQLGAAVRASLTRSGGSAKDRAAALLALQLRVAALLEDWIKKVRHKLYGA
jgi:hypothetical protein